MADVDRRGRTLRARVVYVGAAGAGKTTNLRQIGRVFEATQTKRQGAAESLVVLGGRVGPYALHVEVVVVSGRGEDASAVQARLLRTADCAVVVCDSTPRGVAAGQESLRALRASLQAPWGRIPLVLQANKQDAPEAVEPAGVARALDLGPWAEVVPGRALRGIGVRETLILVMRVLASAAQRLLAQSTPLPIDVAGSTAEAPTSLDPDVARDRRAPAGEALTRRPPRPDGEPNLVAVPAPGTLRRNLDVPVPELRPPALPDARVETTDLWPPARRDVLRQLASVDPRRRDDLIGRHGPNDGSGASDAFIYQAGDFCLKTSPRRRFADPGAARTAMTRLARKKQLIEHLVPDDTVVCLRHEGDGSTWLWTIARWVTTLRAAMSRAERGGDEAELGEVLVTFATVAVDSMVLNVTRSVVLDVHPSNFGSFGGRLFYVDDDIGLGARNPAIGHAILRRFEEYARYPSAVQAYLSSLEHQIATRLTPREIVGLEVASALEGTPVRSTIAHEAREQLCRMLARYTAPATG